MPSRKSQANSVLIVSKSKQGAQQLADMFDNMEFYPITTILTAGEARRKLLSENFDIIIINAPLADETGHELALDAAERSQAGILLLVKNEIYDETRYRVERGGVLTLGKPFSSSMFNITLNLIAATRQRLRLFEEENKKLRNKIDEIRIVNRAKWALIEARGMNEEEAHKYIEKSAMDSRLTRREIAENILKEYEN